jgi:hypothetical protein
METEIRRIVAAHFRLQFEEVGVLRGHNMTLITIPNRVIWPDGALGEACQKLEETLKDSYIHLGLIRFL